MCEPPSKPSPAVFNVTGIVYLEDGISPAPPGLTVKVTNANQGVAEDGWTTDDGSYSVTLGQRQYGGRQKRR